MTRSWLFAIFRQFATTLSLALACTAVSASTPTYSLIFGPRVELDPYQGVPPNLVYSAISGSIGDLNGDGALDIALGVNGAPPAVYLNNRSANPFQNVPGIFVAPPPGPMSPGISWGATVIVDANADGHPDLAIGGFNAPNRIYLNDGTSTPFDSLGEITIGSSDETAFFPGFGDVNGDGYVDLAVANTNHIQSRIYLTQGAPLTSGGYLTVNVGPDLGYGNVAKIVDVNGDAKPDLLLTYSRMTTVPTDPSGLIIYINNGTSDPFHNVDPLQLLFEKSVNQLAIADLNNDGKVDIATTTYNAFSANPVAAELVVFYNTGSTTHPFSSSRILEPNGGIDGICFDVTAADVDGDSRIDLLFSCAAPTWYMSPAPANASGGSIYLNNGTIDPYAGVQPVALPASSDTGYGRSVAVGKLVANDAQQYLVIVDNASNRAHYRRLSLVQNPSVQNDTAVAAINRSAQIMVLANDEAAPGQILDPASIKITTAPQHGIAHLNTTNGAITYQATTGYTGIDSFSYSVRDGLGAQSLVATVSILVQPAPVATNDMTTLSADQSVSIDVLSNDTSNGGTIDATSAIIVVAPVHGSAVITNGRAQYLPSAGYAGVDAFQYSVQDNLGTPSNLATVSLSVQAAPIAANDNVKLQANQNVTIHVLANDKSEGGTLNSSSVKISAPPAHGSVVVANGEILYTPSAGYSGVDAFQYAVQDNLGAWSNAASVSIEVAAPATAGGGGGSVDILELLALLAIYLVVWRRTTDESLVPIKMTEELS